MTESEQNKLAWPVASSELITIQSVSKGPVFLIFIICAKGYARTVISRTIKTPLKFAAELTQLRQPNDQTQDVSPTMSYGCPCKLCKTNILERPAILELLVSGLFRPFNKTEFSIDRSFQNCSIFLKAFRDNFENSTLLLTSITKFLFVKNR